jgi:hypothetical protein
MRSNVTNPRRARLAGLSFVAAIAIGAGGLAPAFAFTLVTPDEAARERARGDAPRVRGYAKGDIGGPAIVLVQPDKLKNLLSPMDIVLRFLPKAPSKIVRESFRARYGFFGIDVTDRLTQNAEVTPSGIRANDAELPAGSHSITIEISDDRARVGRRTFEFEVGEK